MADQANILAGVEAGGATGLSLLHVAPIGSTAPTAAASVLDAAFLDAGLVTTDGLSYNVAETINNINAFGSNTPVRKVPTSSDQTFGVTLLESNAVSLALYHRLPLAGTGSLAPVAGTGAMAFTTGAIRREQFAAVLDIVDGDNRLRAYAPLCEVTDRGNFQVSQGNPAQYPVTVTAFPGSDGVAIHWFYVVANLG
jgi:hypothetical protein